MVPVVYFPFDESGYTSIHVFKTLGAEFLQLIALECFRFLTPQNRRIPSPIMCSDTVLRLGRFMIDDGVSLGEDGGGEKIVGMKPCRRQMSQLFN